MGRVRVAVARMGWLDLRDGPIIEEWVQKWTVFSIGGLSYTFRSLS